MRNDRCRTHADAAFLISILLALLVAACPLARSQPASTAAQGLAPTPPMGWGSWNPYFCDYNDQSIRDQADALVSSGLRDLGYRYVLIQECLTSGREADGSLIVDAQRFPHGMKALVDYVHSRGLKAGTYTDVGEYTCAGKPYQGSYRHEDQDAATFAGWGMDFVEMDYCNRPHEATGRAIYERMAEAIRRTGRPMLFYICSWGNESPWTWAQGTAQLWRTDSDLSSVKNLAQWENVVKNFESNGRDAVFSAPNSWNDPDMMEVGNPGITPTEAQTHYSMWAISAAPLWAGNDLTHMDAATRSLYANPEVIAIDQDQLGAGPVELRAYGAGIEVWMKPLCSMGSGTQAVLLLNLGSAPAEAAVEWSDLGLTAKAQVRDVWAHKDLGEIRDGYKTLLPAHGSVLLKVSGDFDWARGATYEAEWPGNLRAGNAALLPCPECSHGYAVSLRGPANGAQGSSLRFTHIVVPQAGRFYANVVYVYSGEAHNPVQVRVNQGQPADMKFPGAIYGTVRIPVDLQQGENSIEFRFDAAGAVDIDRLTVTR